MLGNYTEWQTLYTVHKGISRYEKNSRHENKNTYLQV